MFEVQTAFIGDSWENVWSESDTGKPLIFNTVDEALKEIVSEIEEYSYLVKSKQRDTHFIVKDHRIVDTTTGYIMPLFRRKGILHAYSNKGNFSAPIKRINL